MSQPHSRPDHGSAPSTPGWVKVFGIIFILVILLVVILHLTGHGFGSHMHMLLREHGVQRL